MSDHRTLMRQVTKEAVMAQTDSSGRWVPLCQQCWQDQWPDQYCPELTGEGECVLCGQQALIVNVNPSTIARHPAEVYGTPKHESWLIEMERQEG